jgi:COP9 signalosome complex subunit 5
MSAGKVDIGCFRVFPESYIQQIEKQDKLQGGGMIPAEKLADFGLHAHKYYQLEHSFFKSKVD